MRILKKISDLIATITTYLSGFILFIVAIVLFAQVFMRFVLNSGFSWSEEFARYAIIWSVMLIANVLIKDNELITVDFLDALWPKKMIRFRDAFYQLVILFLLIILIKEGWGQAVNGWKSSMVSMNIKWFYAYFAIPMGTILMLYQYFYRWIRNFVGEAKLE